METNLPQCSVTESDQLAISVRNAYKNLANRSFILNGFNMSVRKGSIYGLLGPSGCGKTTLLNCLMGRSSLDAGEIKLHVSRKHDIGYMPQEISLYKEFTIWESVVYFGKLYKLSMSSLEQKIQYLKCLFNLPSLNSQIGDLSGGQQRRVSFVLVLLHDSQLLILDEPTVGVDPILRDSIWTYLVKYSREGKTVVITTHYIEEAKQAHCVGFMRDGVLLAEDSPEHILTLTNSTNLENAFLHLCLVQRKSGPTTNYQNLSFATQKHENRKVTFEKDEICNITRVMGQLLKQCYWMKKNISTLLFILTLPVVVLWIYCLAIGHSPENVSLGVINNEVPSNYADIVSQCPDAVLSCRYLEHLRKYNIKLISYKNIDESNEAVKKHRIWGSVEFSKNYSSSLLKRIELGMNTDPYSEEHSNLFVTMDQANIVVFWFLNKVIRKSQEEFLADVLTKLNVSDRLGRIPILFQPPLYGTHEFDYTQFSMPGILVMFTFYIPFVFTSASIVMEKTQGLIERSLIAGVNEFEVFLSHLIIQMLLLMVQLLSVMLLKNYVLQYNLHSNMFLPFLLLYMIGLCGMFFGFTVGFFCDSQYTITFIGVGSVVPQFAISGMLWPIEGMHPMLKAISPLLPMTVAQESLRTMYQKNWNLLYAPVYKGFISSTVCIACLILFCYIGFKYKNGFQPIR